MPAPSTLGPADRSPHDVAYTRVAHEGGFDLAAYPKVQAWVKRVEAALKIA